MRVTKERCMECGDVVLGNVAYYETGMCALCRLNEAVEEMRIKVNLALDGIKREADAITEELRRQI